MAGKEKSEIIGRLRNMQENAKVARENNEDEKAVNIYERMFTLLVKNEGDIDNDEIASRLYRGMGTGFFKEELYQKAINCFDRALSTHKENTRALLMKGWCYKELDGKEKHALGCFNVALKRDEGNPKTWLAKIRYLLELGLTGRALETIRDFLKHDPSNISHVHQLVLKHPDNPVLWKLEGEAFKRQGKEDRAIKALCRSLKLKDDDEVYQELLELAGDDTDQIMELADKIERETNVEKAGEFLDIYLEKEPKNEQVREKREEILEED